MSEYDVFVSYSRKDSEFVRQLVDALSEQQRAVWIDWRGIDYSTKWWEEICYGIDRADNILVVISPDSLNSVYCHREIEHARKRGKRIICLIYRQIDEGTLIGGWYTDETMHPIEMMARENWEHLKTIQFISYPKLGDLAPTIQTLLANIDTDPECKRAHTLLLQQTQSWIDAGRSPGYLIKDEALQTAETRLNDCREHVVFSAEQEAFVSASRRAEDEEARRIAEQEARTRALEEQSRRAADASQRAAQENARLGRTTRRYRIAAALLALVGVVALALTVLAVQRVASTQAEVAQAEQYAASLNLASNVAEILSDERGNQETAALLALHSLDQIYTPNADRALIQAVDQLRTVRTLDNHGVTMRDIVYSPDGLHLATAGDDGNVYVWDVATGDLELALSGHQPSVRSVAYSPDGRYLVSAGDDGVARVWDAESGAAQFQTRRRSDSLYDAIYSPNGRYIMTLDNEGVVRTWSAATGLVQGGVSVRPHDTAIAYSPDHNFIATGDIEGVVYIWSAFDGSYVASIRAHDSTILSITFSPDSAYVLSAGEDLTARLWQLEFPGRSLGKIQPGSAPVVPARQESQVVLHLVHEFRHQARVHRAIFDPNQALIITASGDATVRVWDANDFSLLHNFVEHRGQALAVAYSPIESQITSASADGSTRVWSPYRHPDAPLWASVGDQHVFALALDPDGMRAAATSEDGSVTVWDIDDGAIVNRIASRYHVVSPDVAYDPSGSRVVTTTDSYARVWSLDGDELFTLEERAERSNWIYSAVFSPDGRYIATASEQGWVRLWDAQTGESVRHVFEAADEERSVAFSPDGSRLAAAGDDGLARVWDVGTDTLLLTLAGHHNGILSVAFSPDGRSLVTASQDMTARIWDAETGVELHVLAGHRSLVKSAVFSPDGRLVATVGYDATARIWDAETGAWLRTIAWSGDNMTDVAFTPDGQYLLTTDWGGNVRQWDIDVSALMEYACTRIFADLPASDRLLYAVGDAPSPCPQFAPDA